MWKCGRLQGVQFSCVVGRLSSRGGVEGLNGPSKSVTNTKTATLETVQCTAAARRASVLYGGDSFGLPCIRQFQTHSVGAYHLWISPKLRRETDYRTTSVK